MDFEEVWLSLPFNIQLMLLHLKRTEDEAAAAVQRDSSRTALKEGYRSEQIEPCDGDLRC